MRSLLPILVMCFVTISIYAQTKKNVIPITNQDFEMGGNLEGETDANTGITSYKSLIGFTFSTTGNAAIDPDNSGAMLDEGQSNRVLNLNVTSKGLRKDLIMETDPIDITRYDLGEEFTFTWRMKTSEKTKKAADYNIKVIAYDENDNNISSATIVQENEKRGNFKNNPGEYQSIEKVVTVNSLLY